MRYNPSIAHHNYFMPVFREKVTDEAFFAAVLLSLRSFLGRGEIVVIHAKVIIQLWYSPRRELDHCPLDWQH